MGAAKYTHHDTIDLDAVMLNTRANGKIYRLVSQWPISIVAIGIALTLIWIAMIAWIPLRLVLA